MLKIVESNDRFCATCGGHKCELKDVIIKRIGTFHKADVCASVTLCNNCLNKLAKDLCAYAEINENKIIR